ncbi:unnamed protein product [Rhizophagus irregularis]|nr:unnamed protein product [Rhizophagus irregularis]
MYQQRNSRRQSLCSSVICCQKRQCSLDTELCSTTLCLSDKQNPHKECEAGYTETGKKHYDILCPNPFKINFIRLKDPR